MKKMLTMVLAMTLVSVVFLNVTAFAKTTVNYYDADGNPITVNGLYYNSDNYPMFNSSCYYTDADGNLVYVGGCRAYYYDADGNLAAGNYYYDTNGKAISRPASYPGGWGCGTYYYSAQGNAITGTYYYDDFGNPIDPPKATVPSYRGYGRCCGRW